MKQIDLKRSTVILDPDRTHMLARPFRLMSDQRSRKISARVMALPENEVHTLLDRVRADFSDRQLKIDEFLRRRFDEVGPYLSLRHIRLSHDFRDGSRLTSSWLQWSSAVTTQERSHL